jgi:hypothetical protein
MNDRRRERLAKAAYEVLRQPGAPAALEDAGAESRELAYRVVDALLCEVGAGASMWAKIVGGLIAMLVVIILLGVLTYASVWLWAGTLG